MNDVEYIGSYLGIREAVIYHAERGYAGTILADVPIINRKVPSIEGLFLWYQNKYYGKP